MKKALSTIALLCLASTAFALDFRATTWLMTKAQVIDSESTRVVSERSFPGLQELVFKSLVNGFTATITYVLENNRLLSGSYAFQKDTSRSAFEAAKKDLIAKYGAASFQTSDLLGWRLEKTEIALAHLPDGITHADFWEKSYFARINGLAAARN